MKVRTTCNDVHIAMLIPKNKYTQAKIKNFERGRKNQEYGLDESGIWAIRPFFEGSISECPTPLARLRLGVISSRVTVHAVKGC